MRTGTRMRTRLISSFTRHLRKQMSCWGMGVWLATICLCLVFILVSPISPLAIYFWHISIRYI